MAKRPAPAPTPTPAPTVTATTVNAAAPTPTSASAGSSVSGSFQISASGSVTVKAIGVAVRDSSGAQYDYPGAATNVTLGSTPYTYTSSARTFPAGTYTAFGFWQDSAGAYHDGPSVTLTVSSSTSTTTTTTDPAPAPTPAPTTDPSTSTSGGPVGIPGTWTLKQSDEFNGTALDTAKWRPGWFGSGVSGPVNSGESACYSSSNVSVPGDGAAHLKVTAAAATCGGQTRPYTGALLSTNPKDGRTSGGYEYTYGAVEARVYLPAHSSGKIANWPAVWTDGQSWPSDGENDIMEGLGGTACWHFHSPSGGPGGCASALTGWHTFASEWAPGSVTYYYDGVKVGSITTGITSSPNYLLLDNTTSGYSSTDPTMAPADMLVDYIRVWQH